MNNDRLRWLAVLSLLGEAAAYLPRKCDLRDSIETAMEDATENGVRVRKVLLRYDISPGSDE